MPVLSSSDSTPITGLRSIYVALGSVILLAIFLILRRSKSALTSDYHEIKIPSSDPTPEFLPEKETKHMLTHLAEHPGKPRVITQNPPLPTLQPFTPPLPSSLFPKSFAASPTELATVSPSSERTTSADFSRRRSYNRTLTLSSPGSSHVEEPREVQVLGDIVMAEGWRRHTRVFGGGACKACEESERRMTT